MGFEIEILLVDNSCVTTRYKYLINHTTKLTFVSISLFESWWALNYSATSTFLNNIGTATLSNYQLFNEHFLINQLQYLQYTRLFIKRLFIYTQPYTSTYYIVTYVFILCVSYSILSFGSKKNHNEFLSRPTCVSKQTQKHVRYHKCADVTIYDLRGVTANIAF